jgi:hypothetical protein
MRDAKEISVGVWVPARDDQARSAQRCQQSTWSKHGENLSPIFVFIYQLFRVAINCTTLAPVLPLHFSPISVMLQRRRSFFHEYLDVHQPAKSDYTLVSSVPYLCYLIRQMPATHCCPDNFAYRCVHTLVLSRVSYVRR